MFRIASGSAAEVRAALDVAAAWRYAEAAQLAEARATADRIVALLYPLTR